MLTRTPYSIGDIFLIRAKVCEKKMYSFYKAYSFLLLIFNDLIWLDLYTLLNVCFSCSQNSEICFDCIIQLFVCIQAVFTLSMMIDREYFVMTQWHIGNTSIHATSYGGHGDWTSTVWPDIYPNVPLSDLWLKLDWFDILDSGPELDVTRDSTKWIHTHSIRHVT